jgi:hypothetical protein
MDIRIEFTAGDTFEVAASQAIAFARKIDESVVYNWNGIDIYLNKHSTEFAAQSQWKEGLEMEQYIRSQK